MVCPQTCRHSFISTSAARAQGIVTHSSHSSVPKIPATDVILLRG